MVITLFQFLIGRLKTKIKPYIPKPIAAFQFLIGRLKTGSKDGD